MFKWKLFLVFLIVSSYAFGEQYVPKGLVDINPKSAKPGDVIRIYFNAKKSKDIINMRKKSVKKDSNIPLYPDKVYIHLGYNNWVQELTENEDFLMTYLKDMDCWVYDVTIKQNIKELDFVFKDDLNNWESNRGKDYKYKLDQDSIPPEKVKIKKVIPATNDLLIEWEANGDSDLDGYQVYKDGILVTKEPLKDNFYKENRLQQGEQHIYKISAVDFSKNESETVEVKVKILKNTINVPDTVYVATLDSGQLRLIADTEFVYNWVLVIMTESGEVVRSYKGRGNKVVVFWDFRQENGQVVMPGNYKYMVSVVDEKDILSREVSIQILD